LVWEKSASNVDLRRTGIDLMPHLPWGTHICLFYETRQDLIDTHVAYFKTALENNEFCLWAVSEPVTVEIAREELRRHIVDFDRHLADGRIEIIPGRSWYLKGDPLDVGRIVDGWRDKLGAAVAKGCDGMKASGNSFWQRTDRWAEFSEYEHALEKSLAGLQMIILCTYAMEKSDPQDLLNVARAHQCTIAYRQGGWDFLEVPKVAEARQEIRVLNGDLDVLSRPFAGRDLLTQRERVILAQIVKGNSSKAVARTLGISPRTVDFHRANLMQKLGAKNAADLVRLVLGGA
jgi:DNA-binding CsgD family transcriptional regulator